MFKQMIVALPYIIAAALLIVLMWAVIIPALKKYDAQVSSDCAVAYDSRKALIDSEYFFCDLYKNCFVAFENNIRGDIITTVTLIPNN